jgi:hypothetical protein
VRRFLVLFGFAASLFASALAPARAEGVRHPPPGAPDPYRSMMQPGGGGPCCNGRDCGIAERCTVEGARAGYLEGGRCWPLPPDRYVPPPVELGRSADLHVCRAPARTTDGKLIGVLIHCWTDSFGT